jgi:2-dehydropantoate 2-reductase
LIAIVGAGAIGRLWASSFNPDLASFLSTRDKDPKSISFCLRTTAEPIGESDKGSPENSPKELQEKHFNFAQHHVTKLVHNAIPCSLIWICTKSTGAYETCASLDGHLPKNIPFVLMQNGLGSQKAIIAALPDRPVYAAVTTHGANMPNAETLVHAGYGDTFIGPINQAANNPDALNVLSTALQHSSFEIQHKTDIWQALWQKLIINCAINPFTAILNLSNGDIADSRLFQELWPRLRSELKDTSEIAGYPMTEEQIETQVLSVMHSTRHNISSMLQDIRAGRSTEIDDITGYVCEVLASANKSKHANQILWEQVHALRN